VMTSAARQVGVKIAQHLIEERTNKHE
jgi:hypothetical protein